MGAVRSKVPITIGGLFSFTANFESAVDKDSTPLHMICTGGGAHAPSGVTQAYRCTVCSNEDKSTFVRGTLENDTARIVSPEELALMQAPEEFKRGLNLAVHKRSELVGQTLNGDSRYFLNPTRGESEKAALVASWLREHPDFALTGVFATRSRPAMYEVLPFRDGLVAQQLAWPHQIRSAPEISEVPDQAQLGKFTALMDMVVTPFDMTLYRDAGREEFARRLTEGETVVTASVVAAPTLGTSLNDTLAKALDAAAKAKTLDTAAKPKRVRKIKPKVTESGNVHSG